MDGLKGDKVAKRLLWLTNNPSLFVATTLIGNNIANYLTSLAIVLGSRLVVGRPSLIVDILAPIALAPILFIYGESLPKRLFLKMPNYLLRKSGLLFMFFFWSLVADFQFTLDGRPNDGKANGTITRQSPFGISPTRAG